MSRKTRRNQGKIVGSFGAEGAVLFVTSQIFPEW
jgi:hypothetical protein